MGVLSGTMTVRRYRVEGQVPHDVGEALDAWAFRPSADPARRTDIEGWVSVHNLLDTGFGDRDTWLYDHYAVFALRIDRKVLPARLVRALLEKRESTWRAEHGRPRVPREVRDGMKEQIEDDLLARSLPRVQVHEVCWDLTAGCLLFHHQGETVNERFRALFHRTFGLRLRAETPLDLVADAAPELLDALLATGGTHLGGAR